MLPIHWTSSPVGRLSAAETAGRRHPFPRSMGAEQCRLGTDDPGKRGKGNQTNVPNAPPTPAERREVVGVRSGFASSRPQVGHQSRKATQSGQSA
jgi:hypothetical protein